MTSVNPSNRKCGFCDQIDSKYSCPRCARFYCGSECYRSKDHLQCSEQFYRKCVLDTLKSDKTGHGEMRKKTMEILKREYEQSCQEPTDIGTSLSEDIDAFNEDEEIDSDQLNRLLQSLELDDPTKLWEQLNEKQKKEFEDLIQSEAIFNLVPLNAWQPWYVMASEKPSIKVEGDEITCKNKSNQLKTDEFDSEDDDDEEYLQQIQKRIELECQQCPPKPVDIVPINQLISRPVSSLIQHSIINVLFNYCLLCRHFGGELHTNCEQVIHLLFSHSLVSSSIVFNSTPEALQYSIQRWIQHEKMSLESCCLVMEDLLLILNDTNDRRLYLNILGDLVTILEMVRKKEKRKNVKCDRQTNLKSIHKKLIFYLSWTNENLFKDQVATIQLELISMKSGQVKEKSDNTEIKLHD